MVHMKCSGRYREPFCWRSVLDNGHSASRTSRSQVVESIPMIPYTIYYIRYTKHNIHIYIHHIRILDSYLDLEDMDTSGQEGCGVAGGPSTLS